ncbi:hypothetical protein BH09SUM1_BH09SUM1_18400 [soil metagenome]
MKNPKYVVHAFLMLTLCAGAPLAVTACREKGPAEKAGEKVDDAVGSTKDAAHDAKNDMKDAAHDAKNEIKDTAHDVKNDIKDAATDVKNDMKK